MNSVLFSDLKSKVVFLVMGIFSFSPLVSSICLDILHLPLVTPELFFIPLAFLLKKKIKTLIFDTRLFELLFLASVILLLLAFAINRFQISGIISIFRSYIYIALFFCCFNNYNDFSNEDILWLCMGSLIGWCYDSYHNFARLISEFSMSNLTFGMILSIPLFLAISIIKKYYLFLVLGVSLMIFIFIYAGIRRIIAIFILSLFSIVFIQSIGNRKKLMNSIITAGLFTISIILVLPRAESYIANASPQLYYRMFVRTENSLSGEAGEGDQLRTENITTFFDDMSILLPHGFYTNHTSEDGAGIFNDMPLRGLTWLLGFPVTFVLLLNFVKKTRLSYRQYRYWSNENAFPYIITMISMFAMIFLDGSFITYSYCAPITGLCLGRLSYYSKL